MRMLTDRLLVVQHRHHLQSVVERADFIGRELDVVGRQRTRRTFGGPRRLRGGRRRERRRRTAKMRAAIFIVRPDPVRSTEEW